MAVLLEQHLPVPRAMIEAVSARMGVQGDPPAGLLIHIAVEEPGGTKIIDVWESQADYEAFDASRLGPAVAEVAASQGMELPTDGGSAPTFTDAYDVVRGK